VNTPQDQRAASRWRPKASSIIPLTGLAILVGGLIAALFGGGDVAIVVAFLGFALIVMAYGLAF
jgi:hypothetical protein